MTGYYSRLPNTIIDSRGNHLSFDNLWSVFEYLIEPTDEKALKVCWNLDETIAPILRLLTKDQAVELHNKKKIRVYFSARIGTIAYEIWYVRNKGFSVKQMGTKWSATLFHLEQFFPPETPEPKDVQELEGYVALLIKSYRKMGLVVESLYSPINILKKSLNHSDIPTYKDIPYEVSQYALRCGGKAWNEAHKIGHFKQVWDYDQRSAYTNILAQCRDIRLGEWKRSIKYEPQAHYGYARCHIEIGKQVSPIIYVTEEGDSYSPTGEWDDYLTKAEIDCIRRWNIGKVEVLNGWWWFMRESKKPMMALAYRFQRAKKLDDLTSWNAKSILVGMYGYLGYETDKKVGKQFNPPWYAECTSQTRCLDCDFIYSHGIEGSVVHVTTDGVLSEEEVALTSEDISKGWKVSYNGEALIISTGIKYLGGKKPLGLTYDQAIELIKANPRRSYWENRRRRVVTLGEAIEHNRIDLVGVTNEFRTSIDLNIIRDRCFDKMPRKGSELLKNIYTSNAYDVKDIEGGLN